MPNEKILRLTLFAAVAALHALLLLFLAFSIKTMPQKETENARVMKVTDIEETQPPPAPAAPPPPATELPLVEAIAETMIETDTAPLQTVAAPGTLASGSGWDDYLPAHKVSIAPRFDEREIAAGLIYPPIAHRSGIEGQVWLELFVDRTGLVRQIRVLKEEPPDRGFGEAAVKAFTGKRGSPATANGEPVSTRYRYPVRFKLK